MIRSELFKNRFKLLFLIIILLAFEIKAQETILLSFDSRSNIDSIKIENLNNLSYETLKGINFIELQVNWPTTVETATNNDRSNFYPNPFKDQINFEFSSMFKDNLTIAIYDLTGKLIAQTNQNINPGGISFVFNPGNPGVYILRANSGSEVYNAKLICLESNSGKVQLISSGTTSSNKEKNNYLKSGSSKTSENLTVQAGDLFRCTGYSANQTSEIYDVVFSDKSYVFAFGDGYYHLKKHIIQESKPCFIDIIFSVSESNNKGICHLNSGDIVVSEDNVILSPIEIYQHVFKSEQVSISNKIVLLIDKSVESSSQFENIKSAALKFIETIREGQEIQVCVFSDSIEIRQKYTSNKTLLKVMNSTLRSGSKIRNLYGAVETGLSQWSDVINHFNLTLGSLIVFSSGQNTMNAAKLSDFIAYRGDKKIYAVDFGSKTDSSDLKAIVHPGDFFPVENINTLDAVVATIQSDIAKTSNSFYRLNYMSGKRGGEHNLKITLKENTNNDTTSCIMGTISAEGFSSASPGVFLNIDDTLEYGKDTIRCFISRYTGISFAGDTDGVNIYSTQSLKLYPVTFGATSTPIYSWKINKSGVCDIIEISASEAILSPKKELRDTAIITIRDEANDYSKDVVFIIYPPEFPQGQGVVLAPINDYELNEISGMAASVKNPGHYWVHNDSGDDARIYLLNTSGNTVATVKIAGITSRDWEDIAIGPGPVDGETYIYIADIGDLDKKNTLKFIYRFAEPLIDTALLRQSINIERNLVSQFTYQYADGNRDAEILMIDPLTRDLFVVTKREEQVQIYTLTYPQRDNDTLILIKSTVTLPFRMTNGGDISADGKEILIKNLTTVYYWKREDNESILNALSGKAIQLPYIIEPQGEAIAWRRDGIGYLTVSEVKDNIRPLLYFYKR